MKSGLRWGEVPVGGSRNLPYAPGLDGIRAIAVSAVLLYHGRAPWMPGGFLGVDIFFVLSGYLITSLLLAELRDGGGVDLRRFWLRRARRLLPAAVTVIAVSLVVVAAFYSSSLGRLRGDALASLLYFNNWHQVLAHHSYFAEFARPSLLQHYWSLSVEEQFYFVWPLLLVVGLSRLHRRWVVAGTVLLAALSAGLMALLYHPGSDPSRVYYGTDTRATPLMVGALLAFAWPLGRMTSDTGRRAALVLDGLGVIGLGVLVMAIVTWHDYDAFPYQGGFVLVALAAAALIAIGSHPASRLSSVLGRQPLRWIGQRSYGIYLWHWPVMALTRPQIDLSWSLWILLPAQTIVTLALAELSYRYVEMPVRRGEAWRKLRAGLDRLRPRQRLIAASATSVGLVALVVTTGFLPLASSSARLPVRSAAAARPVAAAATKARARPQGVLAVGASVMLAAEHALEHQLGARVDAAVGRQPSQILDRLAAYRAAGALPSNVVVQIGDNGPVWSADITRLKTLLAGVRHVVLVNIREPSTSWEGEVNSQLEQAVQSWPQARIANWLSASGEGALLYDGVHPNPAGQQVYASVVSQALTQSH
jgi:peptidoglycan/LPS O-acetylase OafA/YrhL